jgi:NAD(P)-dependent dehydrogenase (short-subunit alcohol dehydrogenase family)
MQKANPKKRLRKPQAQKRQPGSESRMQPKPVFDDVKIKGTNKLRGKTAVITGGDSGIGRAVSILFAKEGADVVIIYLDEHKDAQETQRIIEEEYKGRCLLIAGDIGRELFCQAAVKKIRKFSKHVDVLVNNAAVQVEQESLMDISALQLLKTFETNIFSMFYLTKAALKMMPEDSAIINTTSVTAYRGSPNLIDYASTKGAIVAFTRSLSVSLMNKKIRVNAVAPGPIWTPLIPASFNAKKTSEHGSDAPMKRAGEPVEVAPCYLFLACSDSSYMSGQVLHPNGGEIING